MNENHLNQIFTNYIEKFEYINDNTHDESYKWRVAKKFRTLMDEALSERDVDFAEALYKVKVCTENMIDSYTQPFYGMVEFARHEPEIVRQMFLDLYSDDGGDIHVLEEKISDFFERSTALLGKYYPGSFLYKQDFHAVSGYLFLYDPEHHYMFKSVQSGKFADCIEFYDDWGSGTNIKLDVYYRMCDWAVAQIKKSPELLATHQSRYELPEGKEMAPDVNKHILLFDLIYCCSVYDLFDGITFVRPKASEKNLITGKRKKAAYYLEEYNKALDMQHKYDEAIFLLRTHLAPDTVIYHKKYGRCVVRSCNDNCRIDVVLENGELKTLGAQTVFAKGFARTESGELEGQIADYLKYLEDERTIKERVSFAEHQLEPYIEYC